MPQKLKLILASASPRRAEILRNAGFDFEVAPANIDESRRSQEHAGDYVRRLAEEKARAAARKRPDGLAHDSAVVIGADTVVEIGGEILGKPSDANDARGMLRRLSDKTHEVHTGLAILPFDAREARVAVETTRVTFARLSEREIEEYIGTGEPFDKAGAYAIQGHGGKFISGIEGCCFNVMGLPLARLYGILRDLAEERQ